VKIILSTTPFNKGFNHSSSTLKFRIQVEASPIHRPFTCSGLRSPKIAMLSRYPGNLKGSQQMTTHPGMFIPRQVFATLQVSAQRSHGECSSSYTIRWIET
jgi:hypothetical protein